MVSNIIIFTLGYLVCKYQPAVVAYIRKFLGLD